MLTNRQLFLQHLGQTSPNPLLLEIERAEGVYMYGPSGEKYIDLISGVSVSNTGHCHPKVVQAVKEQSEAYMHLMVYGEIIQPPQVKYAGYLTACLPGNLDRCYFVNSGSEAVEGALKLARRFTRRSRIVYFRNSYHGSTLGSLSVQGSERYRAPFRPLIPDCIQTGFNDFDGLDVIDERTACVIIEPVQGEAGAIVPVNGFLEAVRQKCSEKGALLIFDEVQTGFGRTGAMFAFEKYGVVPDILVLAKALGGGLPLGAFLSSGPIMSSLMSDPQLGHITTFGGHPVCCAAGLASMKVITEEGLVKAVDAKAALFRRLLEHDLITGIRGEGLLMAVVLKDPRFVRYVISAAPSHGLVLDYFLFCEDAFRIAPPLVISENEISWACSSLSDLLDEAEMKIK